MNIIRRFVGWVAMNPIRFTIWFALSVANGLVCAIFDAPIWLVVFTFAVVGLSSYLDIKAIPAIVLCLSLALPLKAESQPEPEKAGPIAGAAVIVVGGVIVYVLWSTCQRLFPKTPPPGTNSPPYAVGGVLPDCAGSWTYSAGWSCYIPQATNAWFNADNPPPSVSLELTGSVEPNGELRLSAGRQLGTNELLDGADFQKNLAEHGITWGTIGEMSYGLWGRPAHPQEVPIAFSEDASGNKVVTVNSEQPMMSVALERSPDMIRWTRIATSTVPVGQRMKVVDSTIAGQMFYRLRSL